MKNLEPKSGKPAVSKQTSKPFFSKESNDMFFPEGAFFGTDNAPQRATPTIQRKINHSSAKQSAAPEQTNLQTPGGELAEKQAEDMGSKIGENLSGSSSIAAGPLPKPARKIAESQLGVNMGGVQLATDHSAQSKTDRHQAKAVAEGDTVSFDQNRLETKTVEGRNLLGHELTHIAQQRDSGFTTPQTNKDPSKQIKRADFKKHLKGKRLVAATLQSDPRLKGVDISKADENKDGGITTQSEFDKLFSEIDKIDSDGNKDTMASRDADGSGNKVTVALDALGDASGIAALKKPLKDALSSRGFTDKIGHIATRKSNVLEVSALRRAGNKVTQINDPKNKEKITVGKTTFDFKVDADILSFITTLGLSPDMTKKLTAAIKKGPSNGRSELAQVVRMWAPAERGETIPSRLVLSGHSFGGGDVFGGQGSVYRDHLAALAAIMFNAAKLIEDIHVGACYCGGQADVMAWQGIFPKLKTVWAYPESGPTSKQGAGGHMVKWATQTKGRKKDFKRRSISSKGSMWSVGGGYKSSKPAIPLARARKKVTDGEKLYKKYFDGTSAVKSTSSGPLRSYYIDLQSLIQHKDLPAKDLPALKVRRNVCIRLIYYKKSIAKQFNKANLTAIASGYKALGLTVPNFETLSRKDALASIAAFNKALAAAKPQPAAAKTLKPKLKGLADLDPKKIPQNWI